MPRVGEGGVTHVVMESTGVYWYPVWAVLEERFELMLVNARHIKKVPGRKTDAKEVTRVSKLLELANIKLGSVVSDIMGMTGRAILDAMAMGEDDPRALSRLTYGSLAKKREEIAEAVRGLMRNHHRFLLTGHLERIDFLEYRIGEVDRRIEEVTRPFLAPIHLLETLPGVGRRSAETILAEIGDDMSQVPDPPTVRLMGRPLSRQSRERRETQTWTHRQRQQLGYGPHSHRSRRPRHAAARATTGASTPSVLAWPTRQSDQRSPAASQRPSSATRAPLEAPS